MMGNNINGQSNVQQQNNQRQATNNTSANASANFSAATQQANTTPMSQTSILNTLMKLIQQLIAQLQGNSSDGETSKPAKEGGKKSENSSKAKEENTTTKQTNTGEVQKTTTTPANNNKTEENSDQGAKTTTKRTSTGEMQKTTVTPSGESDNAKTTGETDSPASAAGNANNPTGPAGAAGTVAADYETAFGIDPKLQSCPKTICVAGDKVTHNHTATGTTIIPSKSATDFPVSPSLPDRAWNETGSGKTFKHTFHPSQLPGTNDVYKTGVLTLDVTRANTSVGATDNLNIVKNQALDTSNQAGIWTGANAGQTTATITIQLTPAQLANIKADGTFSIQTGGDTTVNIANLELQQGKNTPINYNNITGTASDDSGASALTGTSGAPDSISGGKGDDEIFGLSGNDCLHGDEGDDLIKGGSGNDFASGGKGDDRIEGGSGDDNLSGGEGSDKLFGGSGKDNIFGGKGDDLLDGGDGDDNLYALEGNDTVSAGSGDDNIYSGLGSLAPNGQHNVIDGGSGNDTVNYTDPESAYTVTASPSNPNEWIVKEISSGKVDFIKNVENLMFNGIPYTGNPISSDM